MRTNRLAAETSPYLLQHRHNPVDWYPWGPEALERARAEDKPILLSVGYSACHWCHVMERECFEDEAIAAQMNDRYVCVKVDREERPDLDNLYQTVVQLQRRSGGWPLTVFLLPDGRPFFSGTYFPPAPRHGMPGFPDVLTQVDLAYRTRRDEVEAAGRAFTDAIVRVQAPAGGPLPDDALADAGRALLGRIDGEHGGFGDAPKFPSVPALSLLWRFARSPSPADDADDGDRAAATEAVLLTLDRMARGGVYDHVAGGWHRYSTDREWLAPHFEKMLYDQALLIPLYVEAAAALGTGGRPLREAAERAASWVTGEMTSAEGLFHSATDADSEGVEGRYFVWTPDSVATALAAAGLEGRADALCRAYDVTAAGNWEGVSILRLKRPLTETCAELGIAPAELRTALAALRVARAGRIAPGLDDKAIVAWNALMIAALVRVDTDGRFLAKAEAAADAVFQLLVEDGRLLHSRCKGVSAGTALLDDHAALGLACLALCEATGAARWRDRALALAIEIEARFRADAGYYQTPDDGDPLVTRPRDAQDSAMPSGTGLAVALMLRLHTHTAEPRWLAAAEATLHAHAAQIDGNPFGAATLIAALDAWTHGHTEVVIGADDGSLVAAARAAADADTVVLHLSSLPADHPAAEGRHATSPTAWVCRGQTCSLPLHTAEALRVELARHRGMSLAAPANRR